MAGVEIRKARPDELERLRDIERASGEPFRHHGMPHIADDEPMPLRTLRDLHVWVATANGHPVAWAAARPLRNSTYVEQVCVHPDHAHQRIGARLLDHVQAWATRNGRPDLTLTTFRDIPWNAPYYGRLGFHEVRDPDRELRQIVQEDADRGLDPAQRVCLTRSAERITGRY
jgi:GNAT superfamily N-acetyltransferase